MPTSASVVTPARFAQGLTYAEYLSQIAINKDKFIHSYDTVPLTDGDLAFFRKAASQPNGPAKILILAEAWCGDVYRELPTAIRIAETTGMEARIFLRDQNPDIMDEFLYGEKKSRAIPVFVFYSADHQYITHWAERSASAHAGLAVALDEVKAELHLPPTASLGTLAGADRENFMRAFIPKVEPPPEHWRKDAIKEIRENLAKALGIANA